MQFIINMTIKQSAMVKPSQKTPSKTLYLSKLDMIIRAPKTHTNVFYIYDHPPPSKSPPNFDAEILKNALSEILVPYYPLAGRLQLNQNMDRYEINCNTMGVLFVEAETNLTLKDLNGFDPSATLRELLIPECDYTRDISLIPLFMMQVTWFKCGGLGLGIAAHHHIADGYANTNFIAKLFRMIAGLDLLVSPVHDRIHVAPRDPVDIKFQHLHEFNPIGPSLPTNQFMKGDKNYDTTQSLFKLSKQQIQVLKQATLSEAMKYNNNNNNIHRMSTFIILASHIWRSACSARDIPYDQEVKLYIPVDGRSRLKNPVIPEGYFGNVLFFAICIAKAGDVIHQPIWYTASKIQKSIEKMDDEYLRSSIDHLELRQGLPEPMMGGHKIMYPDLKINSWAKLPAYTTDFGWGPPKAVGPCEIKLEGLSFLMGSYDGDESLTLGINLFSVHMPMFKKQLYNFRPINDSL
ncbi:hypothetical protein RND81_02G109500 [Saponaria officinalis]|uniref:Uncharacterized protein n=1 Tax=Saponaria officinalis TaxID=3572 RepID=A0AAW1MPN0_SAPOF